MTNYEVVIPFKQFINAGQSSFEIMLPQSWVKSRAFYTEQIFIVPDYYSQSAAQYRLDPELELTEMVQFNLALSLRYNLPKTFYPKNFLERSGMLQNIWVVFRPVLDL